MPDFGRFQQVVLLRRGQWLGPEVVTNRQIDFRYLLESFAVEGVTSREPPSLRQTRNALTQPRASLADTPLGGRSGDVQILPLPDEVAANKSRHSALFESARRMTVVDAFEADCRLEQTSQFEQPDLFTVVQFDFPGFDQQSHTLEVQSCAAGCSSCCP